MKKTPPVIHLLAGVTAAGKSAFSINWAKEMGGEILSCDSIAVYQGMDIGSAKPSAEDRQRVVHYGLDLVDPCNVFSVADYQAYAKDVIDQVLEKKTPILVTGGSGFYLQSFLSQVVDEIEVSPEIRNQVEKINQEEGLTGMLRVLNELNPDGLGELDVLNPRRVMRGLERCLASGKTILRLKKEFKSLEVPFASFEKRLLWLDRKNQDLEGIIARRTEQMLKDGLIEETENLLSMGVEKNASVLNSVGYRECIAYLQGNISDQELLGSINRSTRKLVSKQRKWFRKQFGSEARLLVEEDTEMCELKKWNWIRHS